MSCCLLLLARQPTPAEVSRTESSVWSLSAVLKHSDVFSEEEEEEEDTGSHSNYEPSDES